MVITIGREYGAGGRSVAAKLSQRLGIEYYDVDFTRLTSKVSGYSEEEVLRLGEDMSNRSKLFGQIIDGITSRTRSVEAIYQAQRDVVITLSKQPCIIVGRCSNIILREENIPSLDVFLYAKKSFRLKRAAELAENGEEDLSKYVDRRDQLRNTYYKVFTSYTMDDTNGYNICLDTGTLGIDRCVDILVYAAKPYFS